MKICLRKFGPIPSMKPLLLCIEGDSTYLMLRKTFLEQHGYNVIGASTAEEALKVLSEAPVCATITDHFLPGTTGVRLALEMKRIKPDVPIILYSGTVPKRRGKADAFVNKSESADSFLRIVAEVVEDYRSQ
jgi:DNA-binding NtrC family response regulator